MIRSANPALRGNVFGAVPRVAGSTMTIQGTVNKSALLLLILMGVAYFSWDKTMQAMLLRTPIPMHFLYIGALGGLGVAIFTFFVKRLVMYTAPLYAALEGLCLGSISALFEAQYPGIVSQAVFATFGVFLAMLLLYKSRVIRVTDKFRLGVAAATGGIFLVYMFSWILGFFGTSIPMIHSGGPVGIGFSLVVVGIAALNLVMDFDLIEQGERNGAPKFMEWYGGFVLLVTLIWLYLELLRLLAKTRSR